LLYLFFFESGSRIIISHLLLVLIFCCSEYLEWCREYGLSDEESLNLAHHLHEVGLILHFAGNPELKDYIFLNPQLVANSITKALQLRYIKYVV
jgi:hypothetical protein